MLRKIVLKITIIVGTILPSLAVFSMEDPGKFRKPPTQSSESARVPVLPNEVLAIITELALADAAATGLFRSTYPRLRAAFRNFGLYAQSWYNTAVSHHQDFPGIIPFRPNPEADAYPIALGSREAATLLRTNDGFRNAVIEYILRETDAIVNNRGSLSEEELIGRLNAFQASIAPILINNLPRQDKTAAYRLATFIVGLDFWRVVNLHVGDTLWSILHDELLLPDRERFEKFIDDHEFLDGEVGAGIIYRIDREFDGRFHRIEEGWLSVGVEEDVELGVKNKIKGRITPQFKILLQNVYLKQFDDQFIAAIKPGIHYLVVVYQLASLVMLYTSRLDVRPRELIERIYTNLSEEKAQEVLNGIEIPRQQTDPASETVVQALLALLDRPLPAPETPAETNYAVTNKRKSDDDLASEPLEKKLKEEEKN